MINFENLDKFTFPGVGKYGIPQIEPVKAYPVGEFIPMNYAKSCKNPDGKILHSFVDDYQFTRFWNIPDRYIPMLSRFAAVCAPDFSTYTDMPLAMQIYNHYRKHWLAAYWQKNGIIVIPTVCWSDESSFEWCFDGEPAQSVVAVSSVGTQRRADTKAAFLKGYDAMMERLQPETILFWGQIPKECKGNIYPVDIFCKKFSEGRKKHDAS